MLLPWLLLIQLDPFEYLPRQNFISARAVMLIETRHTLQGPSMVPVFNRTHEIRKLSWLSSSKLRSIILQLNNLPALFLFGQSTDRYFSVAFDFLPLRNRLILFSKAHIFVWFAKYLISLSPNFCYNELMMFLTNDITPMKKVLWCQQNCRLIALYHNSFAEKKTHT